MIITICKNHESYADWKIRIQKPHKWFAWYPICIEGKVYWFEWMWRKAHHASFDNYGGMMWGHSVDGKEFYY